MQFYLTLFVEVYVLAETVLLLNYLLSIWLINCGKREFKGWGGEELSLLLKKYLASKGQNESRRLCSMCCLFIHILYEIIHVWESSKHYYPAFHHFNVLCPRRANNNKRNKNKTFLLISYLNCSFSIFNLIKKFSRFTQNTFII